MSKRKSNLTRQGVRDLNSIPSPKAKVWVEPPLNLALVNCKHRRKQVDQLSGESSCSECGGMWDWRGVPYD